MAGLRYLLRSHWDTLRFVLADVRRRRTERYRVLIAFDIYLAGATAIWARIRRDHFVYYLLDSNREVAAGWERVGARGASLYRWLRAPLDRIALSSAELVIAPSESVRDGLRQSLANTPVRVCRPVRTAAPPDARDVDRWRARLGLEGKLGAVFVGSFQYPPNVRAFEYVRDSLAPRLAESCPEVRLVVAGRGSETAGRIVAPNVVVAGTVADLDPLLYACSIGLAPMEVSGGTSLKIVDYLLHGLVTVSTPQAMSGVDASPMIRSAPLTEFPERVQEVVRELLNQPRNAARPAPDPKWVRSYTDSSELEKMAETVAVWEAT